MAKRRRSSPEEAWPPWVTTEVKVALAKLPTRKHRLTILRLIEGELNGVSYTETLKGKDTCARPTWYGRYNSKTRRMVPGWRHNELVKQAFALARKAAMDYADQYAAWQVQKAVDLLAEASPAAVSVLVMVMDEAEKADVKRKAAVDILDRAAGGRLAKTQRVGVEGVVAIDDVSKLSDDELDRRLSQLFEQAAEGGAPEAADGGEETEEDGAGDIDG